MIEMDDKTKKKREKVIREGLDLLLKEARTEQNFKDIQFYINDYLDQGFDVKDYIFKYNYAYHIFLNKQEE